MAYPLKRLWLEVGDRRKIFISIILVGACDGLVVFSLPLVLTEATRNGIDPTQTTFVILALFTLFSLSLVFQWVLRCFGEAFGPLLALEIRKRQFDQIAQLPAQQLAQHHSVYFLSLASAVADGLGGLSVGVFWGLAKVVVTITLFLIATARESLLVAFLVVAIFFVFVFINATFSKTVRLLASKLNTARAKVMRRFGDFMANIPTLQRLGAHLFAADLIAQGASEAGAVIKEFQSFHAKRWLTLHSLFGVIYLGTLGVCLWAISNGLLPLSFLILAVATLSTLRMNLEWVAEQMVILLSLTANISDFDGACGETVTNSGLQSPATWRHIKLRGVNFKFPNRDAEIKIDQLEIEKGKITLLKGESGQGKTTLLNLIAHLYSPLSGTITIEDLNYERIDPQWFRKHVAVISQDAALFDISLRENLLLGRKDLADHVLIEAMQKLRLKSWFDALADGLDTQLGERGLKVSAGQRQRLNLLRGMLLDRELYLIDEPLSHLDAHTAQAVCEFIIEKLDGRTAVIASHNSGLEKYAAKFATFRNHNLFQE